MYMEKVRKVRKVMDENARTMRLINVELYYRNLETFWVAEYTDRHARVSIRFYEVYLQNRRCDCVRF